MGKSFGRRLEKIGEKNITNEKYAAEIAHNVGAVIRKEMLKRAKELSVNITNQKSKKVEALEKKTKKDDKK